MLSVHLAYNTPGDASVVWPSLCRFYIRSEMSSSQLTVTYCRLCCNWVIVVKQLSNNPRVAQTSNNVLCPVPSHGCSSNVVVCQILHRVNENNYDVRRYVNTAQRVNFLMPYAVRQKALKGLRVIRDEKPSLLDNTKTSEIKKIKCT